MAKLTDAHKDEGNESFVNVVITKTICKDRWVDWFVRFPFKLTQCSCMCFSENTASVD